MKAVDGAQTAPGAEAQPPPSAPRQPQCKDRRNNFLSTGAEALQVAVAEAPVIDHLHSSVNGVAAVPHDDTQDFGSGSSLGRHLVNGDKFSSVKGVRAPSEKLSGGISKEYVSNLNLKLVTCNGSQVPEHKLSGRDVITNGKLSDEQAQNLSSIIQTRKKIKVPKEVFDSKNDDDYVMIALPRDKLTGYEHNYINAKSLPGRLGETKATNGKAPENDPKASFTNGTSILENHTHVEENDEAAGQKDAESSDIINETKHEKDSVKESPIAATRINLPANSDNKAISMPDIVCSNDVFNESNIKKKQEFAVNGLPINSDKSVTNGCADETDFTKGSDELAISGSDSPMSQWDRAVSEVKEQAIMRLQEELEKAHQELKLRDEEVGRLSRIRQEVEGELEELTASLFQEAHNMVRAANVKQAAAERSLKESQMQVEVLMAEVSALKTLVLTSTPSRPNPHLHPQIDPRASRSKDDATPTGVSLFNKKHRRSPSHFNLKYGRENSPPESPVKEQQVLVPEQHENKDGWEVDPNIHKEFVRWKENPKLDKSDPFIARIYNEDINLCLDFPNAELGGKVQDAVKEGNIFIEAVSDKSKTIFPKKCALLETPRQCHYRMKLGDQEQWHYISQICRNRIIAVCDFLNYLRYIERGLVKSSVHDIYWEITRLRKEMVLARLGLALSS